MRELVLKKLSEIILKNYYKDKANLKICRFYINLAMRCATVCESSRSIKGIRKCETRFHRAPGNCCTRTEDVTSLSAELI